MPNFQRLQLILKAFFQGKFNQQYSQFIRSFDCNDSIEIYVQKGFKIKMHSYTAFSKSLSLRFSFAFLIIAIEIKTDLIRSQGKKG